MKIRSCPAVFPVLGNRGCRVLLKRRAAVQLVISAQSAPLMVRGQISAHSTSVRAPFMLNNINIVVFSVCKCSFGCMLSTD